MPLKASVTAARPALRGVGSSGVINAPDVGTTASTIMASKVLYDATAASNPEHAKAVMLAGTGIGTGAMVGGMIAGDEGALVGGALGGAATGLGAALSKWAHMGYVKVFGSQTKKEVGNKPTGVEVQNPFLDFRSPEYKSPAAQFLSEVAVNATLRNTLGFESPQAQSDGVPKLQVKASLPPTPNLPAPLTKSTSKVGVSGFTESTGGTSGGGGGVISGGGGGGGSGGAGGGESVFGCALLAAGVAAAAATF